MNPPDVHDTVDTTTIAAELTYRFDGVFSRDQILAAVDRARTAMEPHATVRTYLPVLISRYATELLTAAAQAAGTVAKTVPEILFVCVHNAGRSQMVAAIAAHLAPGKVHFRSAGSHPTGDINPEAIQALAERGIGLTDAYPKPLANDLVNAADVIVTMGCGDSCPYYPGKRYLDWDVADPAGQPLSVVRDIRDDIQARVTALLRELTL
ncbi:arsenate reductase ArsC [Nakamurella aerolata]|uniref:Arsenate reductase ArsC n=1 Tax=Nakamurella aerolata TaxID=1656892 RepID=A0A849A4U9_9ACTN|nr:arsenate reductase ArsC [Nakamurella aerolata]NNG35087.1 arsenate reductase ArsC [Nakamurella aerolata]